MNPGRTYCTLFDSAYLAKGLALHSSLMRHAQPFHLFILALDDETRWLLDGLALPNVTVIPLGVVESSLNLAPVRANRNWMEYCWTLASQLMEYVMMVERPDMLTYLDADLFFYSSPEPIFAEMSLPDWSGVDEASIAIIPHRFHAGNKRLEVNGVYNVGWLTIRNSDAGMRCLITWAQQCRDWCYHRNEDGKFGDQRYLDSWPETYGGACKVIENIGAGCAPWNVMEYDVTAPDLVPTLTKRLHSDMRLNVLDPEMIKHQPLVFYHFHEFTHDENGHATRLTRHPHKEDHKRLIYWPYAKEIEIAAGKIKTARAERSARQLAMNEQGERA